MRIDQLLVFLRFCRTRSRASDLISSGTLRINRKHVRRASQNILIGDVLTLPLNQEIRVIEIVSLPQRRGSPSQARLHYRELDPRPSRALAAHQAEDFNEDSLS